MAGPGSARVEHVFAEQKDRMDLFIRTIGLPRATTKIGLANLVYDLRRLIFLEGMPPQRSEPTGGPLKLAKPT